MRFKLSVDLIYNVDSKRRLLVTASVYVILNKKHWYMRCANYFSKKFGCELRVITLAIYYSVSL